MSIAVCRRLFLSPRSAPACKSALMTSPWPAALASISAVKPCSLRRSAEGPQLQKTADHVAQVPFRRQHQRCIARRRAPIELGALDEEQLRGLPFTVFNRPQQRERALLIGNPAVRALVSSKALTAAALPRSAAHRRAVRPRSSTALRGDPAPTSMRAIASAQEAEHRHRSPSTARDRSRECSDGRFGQARFLRASAWVERLRASTFLRMPK